VNPCEVWIWLKPKFGRMPKPTKTRLNILRLEFHRGFAVVSIEIQYPSGLDGASDLFAGHPFFHYTLHSLKQFHYLNLTFYKQFYAACIKGHRYTEFRSDLEWWLPCQNIHFRFLSMIGRKSEGKTASLTPHV